MQGSEHVAIKRLHFLAGAGAQIALKFPEGGNGPARTGQQLVVVITQAIMMARLAAGKLQWDDG